MCVGSVNPSSENAVRYKISNNKNNETMAKKAIAQTAPEHTTLVPIRGNQVRLTADHGYLLRSKHTGKMSQSVITAHVAGYEIIEGAAE